MTEDSCNRRVAVLAGHFAASDVEHAGEAGAHLQSTSAADGQASNSYRSTTGKLNSYARVHGEVPRTPAKWRAIPTVYKERLQEVVYEKAEGEGIAKVPGQLLSHWKAVFELSTCLSSSSALHPVQCAAVNQQDQELLLK